MTDDLEARIRSWAEDVDHPIPVRDITGAPEDRPGRRVNGRRTLAAAAAVSAMTVAGVAWASLGGDSSTAVDTAAGTSVTTAETDGAGAVDWSKGGWDEIPTPPEGVTGRSPGVWTGEEFVVLGTPSAAFRPADRTWRSLPPAPIGDRVRMAAVWTGTEAVYWGGASPDGGNVFFADGAAYNPSTDSWRLIAPGPLQARSGPVADMVGGAMLVWGGVTRCCPIDSVIHDPTAASYDPIEDSWSELGDVPAPWSGDGGNEATLTVGESLYVFRGQRLGQYDAAADEWRSLSPLPDFPDPGCWVTGGPVGIAEASGPTVFTWSGGCAPEHGAAFDTTAGEWRPTAAAPPGGSAWTSSTTSGDGVVFLVTSSTDGSDGGPAVHAYVVNDDQWVGLPTTPDGALGSGAQLVWTESGLIAWGGLRDSGPVPGGAVYSNG